MNTLSIIDKLERKYGNRTMFEKVKQFYIDNPLIHKFVSSNYDKFSELFRIIANEAMSRQRKIDGEKLEREIRRIQTWQM